MTIDPAYLVGLPPRIDRQHLTRRDAMLYALSVGAGRDEDELRFVYEDVLQALPTLAVTLAYPGFWCRDPRYGIDWKHVLHVGQSVIFHAPLPVEARVRGEMTIDAVTDKGQDKGSLIQITQRIFDEADDRLLASMVQISLMRGDGGRGSAGQSTPTPLHPAPDREADHSMLMQTSPDQALLYRLTGDSNPVHADPAIAREAGFSRPILHGLCTYGFSGRAILKLLCGGDPARLRQLDCRFTGSVFPGEVIEISAWRMKRGQACFQAMVPARDSLVLDHGYVEYDG